MKDNKVSIKIHKKYDNVKNCLKFIIHFCPTVSVEKRQTKKLVQNLVDIFLEKYFNRS